MYDLLHNSSAPDPDKVLLNESLCNEVQQSLTMLPVREAEVLRLFFGLNDTTPHSLEEIGIKYQLTRERVRQIKEKAVRRLKVHSRTKVLKSYLG
jgi:RNA polymerase primary sigma factor